jgi:hypothetical protein
MTKKCRKKVCLHETAAVVVLVAAAAVALKIVV